MKQKHNITPEEREQAEALADLSSKYFPNPRIVDSEMGFKIAMKVSQDPDRLDFRMPTCKSYLPFGK